MPIRRTTLLAAVLVTLPVLILPQAVQAAPSIPDNHGAVGDRLPQSQAGVESPLPEKAAAADGQYFRLEKITVDTTGLSLDTAALEKITRRYVRRNITMTELNQALRELTLCCRTHGYPAAAAYLPSQSTAVNSLTVSVMPGRYGKIKLDNQSGLKSETAEGYLQGLKSGDIITTERLETALYNISGLGGVQAAGVLSPGTEVGTSDVTVNVKPGRKNALIIYAENYGSTPSGRYRYGLQDTLSNLSGQGDRLSLGGLVSNHDLRNGAVSYEFPTGHSGTTVGAGYSRMDYELGGPFSSQGAKGKADTYSIYGKTPLYITTNRSLYVSYGCNYRKLQDELGFPGIDFEKHSHAFYTGLSGHTRSGKAFVQYDLTATWGHLGLDSAYARLLNTVSHTDGSFAKGVANVMYVQDFDRRWDLLVKVQGQLASRNLDSSEDIYLGGANAVRAYPQGEASGDEGYVGTLELRCKTGLPGLMLSTYFDAGHVELSKDGTSGSETLRGYGFAVSYSRPDDWFARLDYARRIGGDTNLSSEAQARGRLWFLLGKVF